MTKSEIIDILSRKQSHLSARDVESSVKILLEQMSDTLSSKSEDLAAFLCITVLHAVAAIRKRVRL